MLPWLMRFLTNIQGEKNEAYFFGFGALIVCGECLQPTPIPICILSVYTMDRGLSLKIVIIRMFLRRITRIFRQSRRRQTLRWAIRRSIVSHVLRPTFESLEERALLATFTVINTGDSGVGSLRQAIINANAALGADVIQFNIRT